jgi:hypothetical protein
VTYTTKRAKCQCDFLIQGYTKITKNPINNKKEEKKKATPGG